MAISLDLLPNIIDSAIETGRPYVNQYGLAALGIGLFTETFIFTGFWFPGVVLAVVAGFLCAAGELSIVSAALCLVIGAIAGDSASYCLGRLAGRRLLAKKERLVNSLKTMLGQNAGLTLLTYHYSPILRPVMPCVAGWVKYPFPQWILYDSIGVTIWLALFVCAGFLAHGTMHHGGNVVLHAINSIGLFVTVWLMIRVARTIRRSQANIE